MAEHDTLLYGALGVFLVGCLAVWAWYRYTLAKMPPEARAQMLARTQEALEEIHEERRLVIAGDLNSMMVCPHCQTRGAVYTKAIQKKAGVSGAKATGALLTGGVSLLAVGLSRHEQQTEAYCRACRSTWHFG